MIAIAFGIAAVRVLYTRLRGARRYEEDTVPRLVIPVSRREEMVTFDRQPNGPDREEEPLPGRANGGARMPATQPRHAYAGTRPIADSMRERTDGDGAHGDSGDSDTIVFRRLEDAPVQLLPGRLEVVTGALSGQELRLARIVGEAPQVTLGRGDGDGAPHGHITLPSPTVSRMHALMEFADGAWRISNLSRTNPVLVNGRPLVGSEGARLLSDGDRIELGEVVCRFRAR